MGIFRFGVSIFANLIMTVVGGFLLYFGSMSLVITALVFFVQDTEILDTEFTAREALATMNAGPMDLFADLTPWLIMFGQLLIGLPLVVFGIRGILKRLQAGVPDEDDGLPKTSLGRIGNTLVFLAGGLIGLKLMIFAMLDVADHLHVAASYVRAQAVVEKTWKSLGVEDEQRGAYYSVYRFRTPSGEVFKSKIRVPHHAGNHFVEGNRVWIKYLPSNPSVTAWEAGQSLSDFILPLLFYAVLVVGGFWGVKINLFGVSKAA
ncbi:DUF3592 domain-containing protein [Denitrobaculum tricleocarpae]|uniref:DUF3592 domain-containing protein n=1 Tax=Denitrobaculum tricleocarpae TaxID=2591009 RepID=A0A545T207_9PROT|nr:DUF3592 domain-containing protein [Denitrobaculum tricleocarpae]TQV71264.1 DUF3592 domain-containing protein [Denitrobaculum tricleocarpae]